MVYYDSIFFYNTMYSPREIYRFMTDREFQRIMNKKFYKRHMDTEELDSPFQDPAKILFLEYLIDQNYIHAKYRNDHGVDEEVYTISTLGNAFLRMYRNSRTFRLKSIYEYYKILFWIAFASAFGSLIANIITILFV